MFELLLENANGNIVNLDDGVKYIITDVTGLNPPSASIFTSKSPNRKGVKYNGSTLNERNITITIKLLGDVEVNRNALYDWIGTESYVKVRYRNSIKNVYCEGHIEECGFETFTDNELIEIAIICEDPYWKELHEIATEIIGELKQFVFPFVIDDPIPFSTIKDSNGTSIINPGSETGLTITIECLDNIKNLRIYNSIDVSQEFRLNTTLEKDWIVIIDTDSSPKTVKAYKPDGSVENLLKYTNNNLTWFTLKRGNNLFNYEAESNSSSVKMTISFKNKYLGV